MCAAENTSSAVAAEAPGGQIFVRTRRSSTSSSRAGAQAAGAAGALLLKTKGDVTAPSSPCSKKISSKQVKLNPTVYMPSSCCRRTLSIFFFYGVLLSSYYAANPASCSPCNTSTTRTTTSSTIFFAEAVKASSVFNNLKNTHHSQAEFLMAEDLEFATTGLLVEKKDPNKLSSKKTSSPKSGGHEGAKSFKSQKSSKSPGTSSSTSSKSMKSTKSTKNSNSGKSVKSVKSPKSNSNSNSSSSLKSEKLPGGTKASESVVPPVPVPAPDNILKDDQFPDNGPRIPGEHTGINLGGGGAGNGCPPMYRKSILKGYEYLTTIQCDSDFDSLMGTVLEQNMELRSQSELINYQNHELAHKDEKIEELEMRIIELQMKLERRDAEIHVHKSHAKHLEEKTSTIMTDLTVMERSLSIAEKQNVEHENDKREMAIQISNMSNRILSKDNTIASYETRQVELQNQVLELKQHSSMLNVKLHKCQGQSTFLSNVVQCNKEDVKFLTTNIISLERTVVSQEEDLTLAADFSFSLEQMIVLLKSRVQERDEDLVEARETIEKLRKEITRISAYEKQVIERDARISQLEKEKEECLNNTELEKALKIAQTKIVSLKETLELRVHELTTSQETISKHLIKIQELNKITIHLRNELSSRDESLSVLQGQISVLQVQNKERETAIIEFRLLTKKLRDEISIHREEMTKCQNQSYKCEKESSRLEITIQNLQEQVQIINETTIYSNVHIEQFNQLVLSRLQYLSMEIKLRILQNYLSEMMKVNISEADLQVIIQNIIFQESSQSNNSTCTTTIVNDEEVDTLKMQITSLNVLIEKRDTQINMMEKTIMYLYSYVRKVEEHHNQINIDSGSTLIILKRYLESMQLIINSQECGGRSSELISLMQKIFVWFDAETERQDNWEINLSQITKLLVDFKTMYEQKKSEVSVDVDINIDSSSLVVLYMSKVQCEEMYDHLDCNGDVDGGDSSLNVIIQNQKIQIERMQKTIIFLRHYVTQVQESHNQIAINSGTTLITLKQYLESIHLIINSQECEVRSSELISLIQQVFVWFDAETKVRDDWEINYTKIIELLANFKKIYEQNTSKTDVDLDIDVDIDIDINSLSSSTSTEVVVSMEECNKVYGDMIDGRAGYLQRMVEIQRGQIEALEKKNTNRWEQVNQRDKEISYCQDRSSMKDQAIISLREQLEMKESSIVSAHAVTTEVRGEVSILKDKVQVLLVELHRTQTELSKKHSELIILRNDVKVREERHEMQVRINAESLTSDSIMNVLKERKTSLSILYKYLESMQLVINGSEISSSNEFTSSLQQVFLWVEAEMKKDEDEQQALIAKTQQDHVSCNCTSSSVPFEKVELLQAKVIMLEKELASTIQSHADVKVEREVLNSMLLSISQALEKAGISSEDVLSSLGTLSKSQDPTVLKKKSGLVYFVVKMVKTGYQNSNTLDLTSLLRDENFSLVNVIGDAKVAEYQAMIGSLRDQVAIQQSRIIVLEQEMVNSESFLSILMQEKNELEITIKDLKANVCETNTVVVSTEMKRSS